MGLIPSQVKFDLERNRAILQKLASLKLGIGGSPTFSGLTIDSLNGVLKASNGVVSGSASMDDIADGSSYKKLSAADYTDLTDGGDSSLHYHSSDRDRSNHTGTQDSSTISDFNEAAQDAVGSILDDGTIGEVVFNYDDNANKISATVQDAEIDHNSLANTHNLTTDIDHNQLTNTHNLTTDIDHGSIAGLGDDDHTQYILADGSRAFSGTVSGITPTANAHLATKEYVDLTGVSRADFFWSDTNSDVNGYNYAYAYETGQAESTVVSSALGEGDDQLVKGFITEAGLPGITSLPEGIIVFRFNAKKGASNQRTVRLYCTLVRYETNLLGTETVIATSQLSEELTDTEKHIRLVAVLNSPVALNIADRLICKVYANVGSGAQDAVVTLYMEGTTDSNFSTTAYSGIWQIHGDVLDDLNTLGQVTQDGEFLVGTGAGSFAWESGDTARTSLGLGSGNSPTFTDLSLTSPSNIYNLSHDSFADFVANEHIDHSSVSIQAGNGLTGGGDLTATRTLSFDSSYSPTFAGLTLTGNITIPDGGTIGQSAGPLIKFDDTNNYLLISGCKIGLLEETAPTQTIDLKTSTYHAQLALQTTWENGWAGIVLENSAGKQYQFAVKNNSFFVFRDQKEYKDRLAVDPNGNIGFNSTAWGTDAAGVISIGKAGRGPLSSPTDKVQLWGGDRPGSGGGTCGLYIRTETGTYHYFSDRAGINEKAPDYTLDVNGSFGFTPGSSVDPVDNGDVVIEFTNNTTLTFKAKGSDGTIRSATLTLS